MEVDITELFMPLLNNLLILALLLVVLFVSLLVLKLFKVPNVLLRILGLIGFILVVGYWGLNYLLAI